jgi:hypothetical protein
MDLNTVQQIERAIEALTPEQLDEQYLQPGDIQSESRH